MADWEEIKRLAADFQRAQLSSTVQRLSERNCIEIVKKLIDLKLLDVIFTSDGKEYLTPDHLGREILDELFVHGGRINLVELQQILNVDFRHVESKASELASSHSNLNLVLGQLVEKYYLDHLAEELNDKLQETGYTSITELIKMHDLPTDFLMEMLEERIGKIIHGRIDTYDQIIYTDAFISRHKAKIRGLFRAITRPTLLLPIMNHFGFQERLFHSILDDLIHSKEIDGSILGSYGEKSCYIPHIYAKTQNEWVDNFYKQNGYFEYDTLIRLGISDPKNYIKKRFKTEALLFLGTCCTGQPLFDQMEVLVEDALSSGSWVDIMPHVPSIFSTADAEQLLQQVLKSRGKVSGQVFCQTILVSERFLTTAAKCFDKVMTAKAEKDALSLPFLLAEEGDKKTKVTFADDGTKKDKKDERRKKATGGGKGGGTQGRESKTKSVKRKGRGKVEDDESDEEEHLVTSKPGQKKEVEFLKVEEMEAVLSVEFPDCPQEFLEELSQHLYRPITRQYQEIAGSIFLASVAATGMAKKKAHEDMQEKLGGLMMNIRLFDKGLRILPEDMSTQLTKHLLKTLATDATNMIFNYLARELMMSIVEEKAFTPEMRVKLLSKLEEPAKGALTKLHSCLNAKSLDDFFNAVEVVLGTGLCEMTLKKLDKKKERQVVLGHRHTLIEQLKECQDPAVIMHLAVLILFQTYTQCVLHASGRFVPQITSFLQNYLPEEHFQSLLTFQGLVIKQLNPSAPAADANEKDEMYNQLQELLPQVKNIATNTKKNPSIQDTVP